MKIFSSKMVVVLLVVATLGFGGCTSLRNTTKDESVKSQPVSVVENESEEFGEDFSSILEENTPNQLEKGVLDILEDTMGEIMKVEFDAKDKIYKLTPTGKGFILEAASLSRGEDDFFENWENVVDNLQGLSATIEQILGKGYSLYILNPENKDLALLGARDGVILYNFIEN